VTVTRREIDRPLGQLAPARGRRRLLPPLRSLAFAAACVAMVAVSGAIALGDRPWRNPAASAVSTPGVTGTDITGTVRREPLPAAAPQPLPASPAIGNSRSTASGGPQIIRVQPQPGEQMAGIAVVRDPSALGQNLRVAHIPEKAVLEDGPAGPLPIRAEDGRRPFDVYARPWSGTRGARVAIVIGGLGLSQTGTQTAIERLPAEVTLAFAPQGNSLSRWMQEARRRGHEILMQVPLEPFDYPNVDPGRNTLTVAATAEENLKSLRWALSRTTNYTGIMNYMGARFVADRAAMEPLMAELGRRGLLYLDDGSSARSVAPELAMKDRVPFAAADAAIDGERDRGAILKRLDQIEATARAKGFALATGSAFDVTVEAVVQWAAEAKRRGIEIVPVSALALDPEKG
jgi:polysaccharide deacetylase 2 family uncharacterized protein YibQ